MAMLLRVSNAKLQEELRDANNSYQEEKQYLRAHLANLRLDLNELHRDDRTITTDDSDSHGSISLGSESELKRLDDFGDERGAGISLHLPQLKNIHLTPGRKGKDKSKAKNKNLRFTTDNTGQSEEAQDNKSKSFLNDYSWDLENKEKQKFTELQKNQEVLRNIGRANLREKRTSLIRLPTINSAKRRTSTWDSGKNVSRPLGQSTAFETFPYLEASMVMKQTHFKIPKVKDPHRSEIQVKNFKKGNVSKRKVQFTRPNKHSESEHAKKVDLNVSVGSVMGGESLNTTLADTSMGDTTMDTISFDEDQIKALALRSLGNTTDRTIGTVQEDDEEEEEVDIILPNADSNNTTLTNNNKSGGMDETSVSKTTAATSSKTSLPCIPRLKLGKLAKKNVMLHNLKNTRTSPSQLALPKLTAANSDKSSDRSVGTMGTKISRLSQETESYKSLYMSIPDPDMRNKTLTDIMFAVRSRMRENEETLRFGETPRPSDNTYCDYLLNKQHSPRWKDNSPRKTGKVAKKTQRSLPSNPAARADKRTDTTASLQKYMRKMYRQRRTIDRVAGEQYKLAHFAGHKQLQMVAQEA